MMGLSLGITEHLLPLLTYWGPRRIEAGANTDQPISQPTLPPLQRATGDDPSSKPALSGADPGRDGKVRKEK